MSALSIEVMKGLFTIAAAVIAAALAIRLYFRQKEYELIKQRYLDGAIDLVSAEAERALGVFNHNWSRCLSVVKEFRDIPTGFDLETLKGFQELDRSRFHVVAHHRIRSLTGSGVFWDVYQLTLAFAAEASDKVTKDIPIAIRLRLTTDLIDQDCGEIAAECAKELEDLNARSHQFAVLLAELHELGRMLELERLNFKTLDTFKDREAVKQCVERLHAAFADRLEPYGKEADAR